LRLARFARSSSSDTSSDLKSNDTGEGADASVKLLIGQVARGFYLELFGKQASDDPHVSRRVVFPDLGERGNAVFREVIVQSGNERLAELVPGALWPSGWVSRLAGFEQMLGRLFFACIIRHGCQTSSAS